MKPQIRVTDMIKLSGVGNYRCASKYEHFWKEILNDGAGVYRAFIQYLLLSEPLLTLV